MDSESENTPSDTEDETASPALDGDSKSQDESTPQKTSITQRWWWSNTLQTVIGAVVALLQLDFITGDGGVWLNWVVFILGGALFVTGVIGLIRAYLRQRTEATE